MNCDICLVPHSVLWGFTVGEFSTDTVYHPPQEWAICEQCRKLLDARNLEGLLVRTDRAELSRSHCAALLSGMILNITGPMVPCTSSDTPLYEQVEV